MRASAVESSKELQCASWLSARAHSSWDATRVGATSSAAAGATSAVEGADGSGHSASSAPFARFLRRRKRSATHQATSSRPTRCGSLAATRQGCSAHGCPREPGCPHEKPSIQHMRQGALGSAASGGGWPRFPMTKQGVTRRR